VADQDAAKRAAGTRAVDLHVRDGMKLGLGSGSTAHWMVRALAERVRGGLDIVGVPSSRATAELATSLGIPLADLNDIGTLDLTIDGADEIDPALTMIKGGGGCQLREKVVACASRRMIAIVDEGKLVGRLGRFPLPVEVIPFGWRVIERALREALVSRGYPETVPIVLRGGEAGPFTTDNSNYILDCHLGAIADPAALAATLDCVVGIVEHGLFIGIADAAIIGYPNGSAEEILPAGLPASGAGDRA
jgi:ribose 5-phosphate isomerase A